MTPIINPLVFYAIDLVNVLKTVALLGIFGIIIIWFVMFVEEEGDFRPKIFQKALITFLILVEIFVPSTSTITKMLVAQNVTYERMEIVGETVQDIYDDIISIVDNDEK